MWVYALLRAAARAGALPQRARAMCGARARGVASLRQLFSEFVLQGCVCRRAREKLRVFAQRGVAYTRVGDRDTSPRWRTLRGAVCRLFVSGEAECQTREWWWVFRPNATHASGRAPLRVAGAL